MKRVVLDTNIVISALLFRGEPSRLVALWQNGSFRWLASGAIVREYARVLSYTKFKLTEPEIRELLNEDILPFITAIEVSHVPHVIKEDPADDHFLACAVAGKADALVSGDHHLLDLKDHKGIPIITPKEFLSHFT